MGDKSCDSVRHHLATTASQFRVSIQVLAALLPVYPSPNTAKKQQVMEQELTSYLSPLHPQICPRSPASGIRRSQPSGAFYGKLERESH